VRALRLQLGVVLRSEPAVGQREHEGHDLIDFLLRQRQSLDPAVEMRVDLAALVVVIHRVPQRAHRAVVHVRLGETDVAQLGCAERADVGRIARDHEAPQLAHVGRQRQLVERLLRGILRQRAQRALLQLLEILVVRRHADVVEPVVGAQRVGGVDRMARRTARLAVEQLPSGLGIGRDGIDLAGEESVERRVEEDQRGLERRDRVLDVLVAEVAPERCAEARRVVGQAAQLLHHRIPVRHPHLDRVQDGLTRLVGERRRAAIPEQRLDQRGIHHGGGIAPAHLVADPLGSRAQIGKAARHVMAGRAGHRVIARQPRIEEQLLAETRLRRRGLWRQRAPEHRIDFGRRHGPPLQQHGELLDLGGEVRGAMGSSGLTQRGRGECRQEAREQHVFPHDANPTIG
jgi:hypothetical protein